MSRGDLDIDLNRKSIWTYGNNYLKCLCICLVFAAPFTANAQAYSYRLDKYRDKSVKMCRMIAAGHVEKEESDCSESDVFCSKIESAFKSHDAEKCPAMVDDVIRAMNEVTKGENFSEFSKRTDFGQNDDPVSHLIAYHILWQMEQRSSAFTDKHKRSIPKDKDALPIVRKPASVPEGAHRSGHCNLVFDVDASGQPYNIKIKFCTARVFEIEAIRAVSGFKYRLKIIDGEPRPRAGVETRVPFNVVDEKGNIIPK